MKPIANAPVLGRAWEEFKAKNDARLAALEEEIDPPLLCPITNAYCTGSFCDDYGCAKEVDFYD